jgi:hypothetical protein
MVGRATETAEASLNLALVIEQMCWPQNDQRYRELRAEAERLIGRLGLADVVVPEAQEEFTTNVNAVTTPVTAFLSQERGRILGDTVALPLFFLHSFALRYTVQAAFGNSDAELLDIVEDCIEDLGLDRELARMLESEVGWITLEADGDEATVRKGDIIRAGSGFVLRVLEESGRTDAGLNRVLESLAALQAEVEDFRAESRAASERLELLISQGNEDVLGALRELQSTLVQEAGVDPEKASELTEGDPPAFWSRLLRWLGGAQARDAGEAALWAALDFVPAGTGVKLGIKVAGAIRRSLKDGGS